MDVKWLILAEGVGQDAKGAFTAIGLSQNVLVAPKLPARTKRAVIVHLAESADGKLPMGSGSITVTVKSPSGTVIAAQTTELEISKKRFSELPGELDIPIEVVLGISEHGEYTIQAHIELPDGPVDAGPVSLYVLDSAPVEAEVS